MMKIVRGQYPPLSPRYSYDIKKVVQECFKRDPAKRPSVNNIIRKPVINSIAIKYEPGLNIKAAPSARAILAEKQKRSRSPDRGGRHGIARGPVQSKVSRVVDQKEREKQIQSVYGNQKVIIPRKSKVTQSREERAKKSRDNEREKMLQGIKVSSRRRITICVGGSPDAKNCLSNGPYSRNFSLSKIRYHSGASTNNTIRAEVKSDGLGVPYSVENFSKLRPRIFTLLD